MEVENLEFHIQRTGDVAGSGISGLSRSLSRVRSASQSATKGLGGLLSTMKRLTKLMILRSIIRSIGKAMREGLTNVYKFSDSVGGQLATALDALKSASTGATGAIGAAFAELLATVAPILTAIISLATAAANALAKLFAVLGGRSTYTKAVASSEKWAKATAGGAAAAKEWRKQLLGFDEINKLDDNDTGGGGGGGSLEGAFEEVPASMPWLESLKQVTGEWLKTVNFDPLIDAWDRLKSAVSDFANVVDTYLYYAYTKVLLPLAQWEIEKNWPAQLNLIASAFELLSAVLAKVEPLFEMLFENIIKPAASFIGDVFIGVINLLTDTFTSLAEKVTAAKSLGEFLESLNGNEAFIIGVATAIGVLVTKLALLKTVTAISKLFKAAFVAMTNPVFLVVVAVGLLAAAIATHWEEIKGWLEEAKARVQENIEGVTEILTDFVNTVKETAVNIVNGFMDGLKGLTDRVKSFFTNIVSLIKNIFGVHSPSTVMASIGSNVTEGFAQGIESKKGMVSSAIESLKGLFDGLVSKASAAWSSVSGFMQNIINKASNASSSLSSVTTSTATVRAATIRTDSNGQTIHTRAAGGYVDSGDLFIANENGQNELIGRIGNRSAVINQPDIVAAVSQGVAGAVANVISSGSRGSSNVAVFNINGKEFMRAVYNDMKSVANERGTSLVNA